MGTGEHDGFGCTSGSGYSQIFTRVQSKGIVTVGSEVRDVSRRVYQRNDIDFDYIDPTTGKSNLELMRAGRAPIGNDGLPVQLHHVLQKESGPMVEIREITHEEYNRILHGLGIRDASFRNDPILDRQYRSFRRQYWMWRAAQHQKGIKR